MYSKKVYNLKNIKRKSKIKKLLKDNNCNLNKLIIKICIPYRKLLLLQGSIKSIDYKNSTVVVNIIKAAIKNISFHLF